MKPNPLLVTALLLLLAAVAQPGLYAQAPSPPPAGGRSDSLGEIAEALGRIADMLERQAEGSRLDLLMKRVDASSRRLGQLESRLRTARSDYDNARENLTRMEAQFASLEERAAAEDANPEQFRFERLHLETETDLGRQRMAALLDSMTQLETEIARRGREMEDWQAYVDRELSGLE